MRANTFPGTMDLFQKLKKFENKYKQIEERIRKIQKKVERREQVLDDRQKQEQLEEESKQTVTNAALEKKRSLPSALAYLSLPALRNFLRLRPERRIEAIAFFHDAAKMTDQNQ